MGNSNLAIVIPAYKDTYFDETLNSLAKQTNKNFTLYIGDDFSPFDLKVIADKYRDQLTIHYTRFSNNIGPKHLVLQWKRCIELTHNEPWLWLFSDDDIMDENCVENFYLTLDKKESAFDVFRFNTITIDGSGEVLFQIPPGPEEESSEQMAYYLLKGERGNSMPDHIFSRKIYNQCSGLVYTDYAQGADWATSILFSKDKGLCIILGTYVYWRYSGNNISSLAAKNRGETMRGYLQFVEWLLKHFEYLKITSSAVTYSMMLEILKNNLRNVLISHYKGFNSSDIFILFNFYKKKLKLSSFESIKELIVVKKNFNRFINMGYRVVRKF